jgi:hypothetical protein
LKGKEDFKYLDVRKWEDNKNKSSKRRVRGCKLDSSGSG